MRIITLRYREEEIVGIETAAFFSCTDPRLADAETELFEQCKRALGARRIIPFLSPGVVGLYADKAVLWRPLILEEIPIRLTRADVRRIALEESFAIHLELHHPEEALIAAHEDCKGHAWTLDVQERDARMAARMLSIRLRQRTGFRGKISPAVIVRRAEEWELRKLE